jgi:hypothetical protein
MEKINSVQQGVQAVLFAPGDSVDAFADISTKDDVYAWVESAFIPRIWGADNCTTARPNDDHHRRHLESKATSSKQTKTYQTYFRMLGGAIISQTRTKGMSCTSDGGPYPSSSDVFGGHELIAATEVLYKDDCHPEYSWDEDDPCWVADRKQFINEGADKAVDGVCEMTHGSEDRNSAWGPEIVYLDFNDTTCDVVGTIRNARELLWLNKFTLSTKMQVVLYNGELGIYSIVSLDVDFQRGGKLVAQGSISSAQVPTWTIQKVIL